MQGICKFCGNSTILRQSHIIPSFVYKWQKETSATGHIRYGEEPDKRVQDGFKPYYFCDDCEGKFNKWETPFNKELFRPINEGKDGFNQYSDWLLKFAVSVSWRVLTFVITEWDISYLPEKQVQEASVALDIWKKFLNNKIPHPGKHQQHMLVYDIIKPSSSGIDTLPSNINRYLLRSIDMDVVGNEDYAYVYTKMGKFVLVGFIEYPHPRHWVGTQIHVKNGTLIKRKYTLPMEFWDHIKYRAERSRTVDSKISTKQRKKIDEDYKKKKDRSLGSETVKATQQDIDLFGMDKVFKKK